MAEVGIGPTTTMNETASDVTAVGVLLAAGAGTRFGMPKVLTERGNWLRLAVRALHEGGCDEVLVVLGAAIVAVPPPAQAVVAADWAHGLSASLRAGMAAATGSAAGYVVLHTVDTPDIDPPAVQRVLNAARAADSGIARARYGTRPGHPVVVARRHWTELIDAARGDSGARAFLRARSDVVDVDCDDLASGIDVDE